MYSEIAAKESCTSTASTIAPPDAIIRPQHTLDQPRRGGDHAGLDSPGMPPGPPPSRPSRARDSCRSEIARRLVLPLWCRDTSPQFVWWHHDLHARRSKVKSPTMRPTGRGVTSSCRDGKTGREIHEHALSNQ